MRRYYIPLLFLPFLAACASTSAPETQPVATTLSCDGGKLYTAVFSGEKLHITGEGVDAHLRQQVAGSGIHYSGEGYDLRGKGLEVTWTSPSGAAVQCRDQKLSMQQPQIQPPVADLGGTKWTLLHYQSNTDALDKRIPPSVENYTAEFTADGALHMQLDCNRLNGRWDATPTTASEGSLQIGGGAMTRAMCQQGAMDTDISMSLSKVRGYVMAGPMLRLILENNEGEYVWQRAN